MSDVRRERRDDRWQAAAAAVWIGVIIIAFVSGTARAQDDDNGPFVPAWTQSYINPFPETDKYQLYVIGDFLAAGLASALPSALDDSASAEIQQETRNSSGLARPDNYNWSGRIENILDDKTIGIAVIMLGSNDRRSIRTASGFEDFGTQEWVETYRLRIDSLIEKLTDAKVAVYWMGLPIVADEDAREQYQQINGLIRERAYLGGIKYIDTWNGFADQFGNFSAFGPSVDGVTKRLRDNNGIGFTSDGNRKLAEFAASVITRDLAAARRERSIPLAGDEQQQGQIARAAEYEADTQPARAEGIAEGVGGRPGGETSEQAGPSDATAGDAADRANGFENRAVSFSDYSPPGEALAIDIGDNLTALATISPANILSARGARQQLPLSERLYYRVLVRGEKIEAPQGRIDNYKWEGG